MTLRRQPMHLPSPPALTPRPSNKDLGRSSDNRMNNATLTTKATTRSPIHKSSPRVEPKLKKLSNGKEHHKVESLASSINNDNDITNISTHAIEEGISFHTINLDPSKSLSSSKDDPEQGFGEGILPDKNDDHSSPTKGACGVSSNCVRRFVNRLRACFKSICTCISNVFIAFWSTLSLLVRSVKNYFKECINNQLEMISLAPKAMKTITSWTTDMERGITLSLTCVVLSLVTTIYPTAPGYNIFIALLLLFVQIKPVSRDYSLYIQKFGLGVSL